MAMNLCSYFRVFFGAISALGCQAIQYGVTSWVVRLEKVCQANQYEPTSSRDQARRYGGLRASLRLLFGAHSELIRSKACFIEERPNEVPDRDESSSRHLSAE